MKEFKHPVTADEYFAFDGSKEVIVPASGIGRPDILKEAIVLIEGNIWASQSYGSLLRPTGWLLKISLRSNGIFPAPSSSDS